MKSKTNNSRHVLSSKSVGFKTSGDLDSERESLSDLIFKDKFDNDAVLIFHVKDALRKLKKCIRLAELNWLKNTTDSPLKMTERIRENIKDIFGKKIRVLGGGAR